MTTPLMLPPRLSGIDLLRPFGRGGPLNGLDYDRFEHDDAVPYALDSNLRFVSCNLSWDRLAGANGAHQLKRNCQIGVPVMGVTPAPLREFYRLGFSNVFETGSAWSSTDECSSSEIERRFHVIVTRTPNRDGLIVVNSPVSQAPHRRPPLAASGQYRNLTGIIIMCAHYSRARTAGGEGRWNWVPAFVDHMPDEVSHSLSPICRELHYGAELRGECNTAPA